MTDAPMPQPPIVISRPALGFLGLGAAAGLASHAFARVPQIGLYLLPGLIYAMVVLMPWARYQKLPLIAQIALVFTSPLGYLCAILMLVMPFYIPLDIPEPLYLPVQGAVGMTIALVPVLTAPSVDR